MKTQQETPSVMLLKCKQQYYEAESVDFAPVAQQRQRQTACLVVQMVNSRDTTDTQPPALVSVDVGCVSLRWW